MACVVSDDNWMNCCSWSCSTLFNHNTTSIHLRSFHIETLGNCNELINKQCGEGSFGRKLAYGVGKGWYLATESTERPHAPSGVVVFMSAHSKTPYITPSMDCTSGKGVVWGNRGQQLEFSLPWRDTSPLMVRACPRFARTAAGRTPIWTERNHPNRVSAYSEQKKTKKDQKQTQ